MSSMPALLCAVFVSTALVSSAGDPGVFSDRILVGQSAALKGPSAGLGLGMQAGLDAAFAELNAAGGVDGRRIELKSVNDSYEPESCEAATRKLVEEEGVFLVIGGVGTPTAKVAVPYLESKQVPFVAPFTGAEFLREPFKKYVVNLRASYYQETEVLAALLVEQRKFERIACFYQNDAYGQAGLSGIEKALERRGKKLVATGTYERNTTEIQAGLQSIMAEKPEAVLLVGTYKACASFMKAAAAEPALAGAQMCNISFVGTQDLVRELAGAGEGSIISQVVPYPWDASVPVVARYQAAMKQAGKEAELGFTSLEGYLAGHLFAQALDRIEGEPTRQAFLAAVEGMSALDLGGIKLGFGPQDHQGLDSVFLTVVRGGKVEPLR